MKLSVLGSGSRGNALAVTAAGVSVLIDVGFGPKILARRATQVGIDLGRLAGIVLTHEHGDHTAGARQVARRVGCPVYASRGTLRVLGTKLRGIRQIDIRPHRPFAVGPFRFVGCATTHDAAEPLALSVTGPTGGAKLGVAYDLGRPTSAVRYILKHSTCLVVEANHDDIMLRTGAYPPSVRHRIAGSRGHLSNRAAGELLATLCHRRLRSVVLVHLSEECNRPEVAEREVRNYLDSAGFRGRLFVARQGEPLDAIALAEETRQLELGVGG